jgi:hypothetical protein
MTLINFMRSRRFTSKKSRPRRHHPPSTTSCSLHRPLLGPARRDLRVRGSEAYSVAASHHRVRHHLLHSMVRRRLPRSLVATAATIGLRTITALRPRLRTIINTTPATTVHHLSLIVVLLIVVSPRRARMFRMPLL